VLVDGSAVTSYPSTWPVFEFGERAAGLLRGMKIAIVVTLEARHLSSFFETVALNRGANVKLCDTLEAALAWLKELPNKATEKNAEPLRSQYPSP